jgi:hypothetical protein
VEAAAPQSRVCEPQPGSQVLIAHLFPLDEGLNDPQHALAVGEDQHCGAGPRAGRPKQV